AGAGPLDLPERGRDAARRGERGEGLPVGRPGRRPPAVPPLRPPAHFRYPPPRTRGADHLRGGSARAPEADHDPYVLRALASPGRQGLRGPPGGRPGGRDGYGTTPRPVRGIPRESMAPLWHQK